MDPKFGDHSYKKISIQLNIFNVAQQNIINDYTSDYRTRLITLNILPMSMVLELTDLCFFVKSLKLHESPNQSFNISDHINFSSATTSPGLVLLTS